MNALSSTEHNNHAPVTFEAWLSSGRLPNEAQFLATLRNHCLSKLDFQLEDATQEVTPSDFSIETRAEIVRTCVEIVRMNLDRNSFSTGPAYLASLVMHEPEDDLKVDRSVVAKLDVLAIRRSLLTTIELIKEKAFDVRIDEGQRDAWFELGKRVLDLVASFSPQDLSHLKTPHAQRTTKN